MACLEENTLHAFVAGRLAGQQRDAVVEHADQCDLCRRLIALAVDEQSAESAATVRSGSTPPGAPSGEAADLGGWERYQVGELVGSGSGGEIYRAWDPRLQRTVALKLLRNLSEEFAARFTAEARNQARVDHDHVCKVYEVGTVAGRPFIAMQFITGVTLGKAAGEMVLEERVRVMAQVAEAVHAAHRLGIIHRDLKPSNIMVNRSEETGWRPFVMDFGLARDLEQGNSTVAGALVGTPLYMAPEQARGDNRDVDRRTDVYGLGATLYFLLVGKAPFEGGSTMELLSQIIHRQPPAPKSLVPSLPADLETIVLKCLDKEKSGRYESAKALAVDLRLFLEGEAILARRSSLLSRATRRARKHPLVVAMIVAAVLSMAGLAVVAARARFVLAEESRLARELGEDSKQIEDLIRISALLPLHDTGPEKAIVRARMKDMSARIARAGTPGVALGRYAIGRGHLALHEYERALPELTAGWLAGYRSPEAAYALGQTMGVIYRRELEQLAILPPDERALRAKELERRYRDPALDHLRHGAGALLDAPEYAEGLIAFYEGRYRDAVSKAESARHRSPWLYEAGKLEGDAWLRMAGDRSNTDDGEQARGFYQRAAEAYGRALAIAHSDDELYDGACAMFHDWFLFESVRGQIDAKLVDQAIEACENAIAANPANPSPYRREALIHADLAVARCNTGADCRRDLDEAISLAAKATRVDPNDWEATYVLGWTYTRLADDYQQRRGIDPSDSAQKAIDAFARSTALRPNAQALRGQGSAYKILALATVEKGGEPAPLYERAAHAYEQSMALQPGVTASHNNLGNIYEARAEYELSHGRDPTRSVEQAVACYQKALELYRESYDTYNNLGAAEWTLAAFDVSAGRDPSPSLEAAIAAYRRSIAINPTYIYSYDNLIETYQLQARYRVDHDQDPQAAIAEARVVSRQALALQEPDPYNWLQQAKVALVEAEWAAHAAQSPAAALERYQIAAERAHTLNPRNAALFQVESECRLRRAEWSRDRRRSQREIQLGIHAADHALSINPEMALALATRGDLRALQARLEKDRRAALLAVEDYHRALSINARLSRRREALIAEVEQAAN